jgi:hypothetical protein
MNGQKVRIREVPAEVDGTPCTGVERRIRFDPVDVSI